MLVRADLPVAIRFAGFWLEQAGRFAPVRSLFGVVSPVGGASWLGEPGQWCGLRPVRWWGGGVELFPNITSSPLDLPAPFSFFFSFFFFSSFFFFGFKGCWV